MTTAFPVKDEKLIKEALRQSIILGLPVIEHCEDPSAIGKWDMNGGPVAKELKLRGMPPGAEEAIIERDLAINRRYRWHLAYSACQHA